MERTTRLTAKQLFGREMPVLPQPLGPSPLATIGGVGGPFSFAPTQAEATAALAQHYGLPTLYIDVTFDATVAAFFATHEWDDAAFRPSSKPGRILRWPAKRQTPFLLEIDDPGRPDPAIAFIESMFTEPLRKAFREAMPEAPTRPVPGLRVIDLTSMDATVRRPRAQRAALACPIYLDGNPLAAEPSLEELGFSDMGRLPGVEVLDLPAGAGAELQSATGVCQSALYPDRIDLGHSFFTIAAFLSIVSFGSPDDDLAGAPELSLEQRELLKLELRLEGGLKAAAAIIARESFRLVPGFSSDSLRTYQYLNDAADELRTQAAVALKASSFLGSPEVKEAARKGLMLAAQELLRARFAKVHEFVRDFEQKTGFPLEIQEEPSGPINIPDKDYTWVAEEIRRRLVQLEKILADANRIPVYALIDPSLLAHDANLFPSDPEYEAAVRDQTSALTRWLGADAFGDTSQSR